MVDVLVLSYYCQKGKIYGELLVSVVQGWFFGVDFFQDWVCYFGLKVCQVVVVMFRIGEYFDFNIEVIGDGVVWFEVLCIKILEKIQFVYEGFYLFGFIDQVEWFVLNCIIK